MALNQGVMSIPEAIHLHIFRTSDSRVADFNSFQAKVVMRQNKDFVS
jgi:hypothetical protein